ncbi:MAG: hypothetical protein OXG49_15030 [Chloroflexi bacterium]|nr:hypothetical protein [Chloroflexota bacterium]
MDEPKLDMSEFEPPEGYEMPDGWEHEVFKIDDTPENVAKAIFNVRPDDKRFQKEYLKGFKKKERVPNDTEANRER